MLLYYVLPKMLNFIVNIKPEINWSNNPWSYWVMQQVKGHWLKPNQTSSYLQTKNTDAVF